MFTGIIKFTGEVRENTGTALAIACRSIVADLEAGGSVSVNGACLTAVSVDADQGMFHVDVSPETRGRTTLGTLRPGHRANLELPLRLGDRLGGHMVQGHVDAVGEIVSVEPQAGFRLFTFRADPRYDSLIIEKGSIAVDGVSLTAYDVGEGSFKVAVIPQTLRETTLQGLSPGDKVNLEYDLLGKYVHKYLQAANQERCSA